MRLFIFFMIPFMLFAHPKIDKVVLGDVLFRKEGNYFEIKQNSKKAVMDWDHFSIEETEHVRFLQRKEDVAFICVKGSFPSHIMGKLEGSGSIYFINSQGIIIGEKGIIDVYRIALSCLDLENEGFLFHKEFHFLGKNGRQLIHQGKIYAEETYLIANKLENKGFCKGKIVGMVAGEDLFIRPYEEDKIWLREKGEGTITHEGIIEATQIELKAAGKNFDTPAINQQGIIQADEKILLSSGSGMTIINGRQSTSKETKGKIHILGENLMIDESAIIDASSINEGGEILIGGDYKGENPNIKNASYVFVHNDALILADAIDQGNGGKVILWSDAGTHFFGRISAKGGKKCGDGGFVEISSPSNLVFKGLVNTTANKGKTGTLLLDPSDIVINDFGGISIPPFPTIPPATYDPVAALGQLDILDITTALLTNNVNVSTSAGSGGNGTITFNSGFTWATANTFIALADRNIIMEDVTITNTNILSSNFTALDLRANQGAPIGADFDGIFIFNSQISSVRGNIFLQATGGTSITNAGVLIDSASSITSTGTGTEAATITINGTGGNGTSNCMGVFIQDNTTISSVDGGIALTGSSTGTGTLLYGLYLQDGVTISSTGTGANAATISLNGTGGNGTFENKGIFMETSTVTSSEGDISLTGIGNGTDVNNFGIHIFQSDITSTSAVAGAALITIDATSGAGVNDNHGMLSELSTISSISGDILITPVSLGTGNFNNGLALRISSLIESTGVDANAADITINATGGGGTEDVVGVHVDVTSDITAVAGTITITGGVIFDTE